LLDKVTHCELSKYLKCRKWMLWWEATIVMMSNFNCENKKPESTSIKRCCVQHAGLRTELVISF
jgi:hypothetical protein